jgi:hypothetical protein
LTNVATERKHLMKRLTSVAVAVGLAVGAASTSWAGQEPYVGVAGDDIYMNRYYLEAKLWRWLHEEGDIGVEESYQMLGESFGGSANLSDNAEVCIPPEGYDLTPNGDDLNGSHLVPDETVQHLPVDNAGHFRWVIQLPKKPRGNINIQLQCGVLKPNTYGLFGMPKAVDYCSGETGEIVGDICDRKSVNPNQSAIAVGKLPRVTVKAYPSMPVEGSGPFHMTAFRVPGTFSLNRDGPGLAASTKSQQVLDGGNTSRVVLKSCQPETLFVKWPVSGQINGKNEVESDLEAGDKIEIKLDFPRGHTMDVYCNQWSAKIMGIGDPATEDDVEVGL